ncbi:MAG TPA: peptidase domain-containing ABC transporter, partial [Rubrivivax sp.]|nr:peptidase domain-containing ABC transporter [Rubrivivax sp.]
ASGGGAGWVLAQWVVDGALVSGDRDLLLLTVLGGGLLMIVQFLLSMARGWISLRMNQQLSIQFTANLFAHLLRLPLAFFEKRHVGDITSRFGSLAAIRGVLTQSSVSAALDGVMAIVTLAMMLLYSPKLSVVVLVALGLYLLLRWASFAAFRAANEERIVLSAREQSYFLETIRAVQPLKLFNRTPERLARWQNLMVDVQNRDLTTQKMDLWFSSANTLIFGVEGMLILYLGGTAVLERSMTLGMLLAFMAYKEQFATRVSGLIDKVVELKMLRLQGERLADIVLTAPEPEQATGPARLGAGIPAIELRDLSFAYSDAEPEVLSGVSLRIEPGESVAIVGPSGCGKTTLLKTMLGIHTPQRGELLIGGVPLAQLGLRAWRDMVGVVMQDEPLFCGSIADNISFFDLQPDMDWVAHCARVASVHDDIEAMPMGYHTLIGDMGSSLSGGQKQRILLARALYKRPKILLLDEATSALDVDGERLVNQAVRQLALTRVIVAHRPETIASAARVVALQGGRVAQDLRSVGHPANTGLEA